MPATGGSTCQNDNRNSSPENESEGVNLSDARQASQNRNAKKNENSVHFGGGSTSRNAGST